jgi:AcrR family transcriptional regulator
MQQGKRPRVPNRARSEETQAKLIAAARALFVEKGYSDTGTPEIVKAADVTRGALYHHFEDKADLFRAVARREAEAVAAEIDAGALEVEDPIEALAAGGAAYFEAMRAPGRARLLLIDGPAVLGADGIAEIDDGAGAATLRAGLRAAAERHGRPDLPIDALAAMLSAAFDRAALEISAGAARDPYEQGLRRLLTGLFGAP